MFNRFIKFVFVFVCASLISCTTTQVMSDWEILDVNGEPTARHEAAFVGYKDELILIGGRRINSTDVFDVESSSWVSRSPTPLELHHFQPVVIDNAVYIVGAMTGGWPHETPVENVIIYYPDEDRYEIGDTIPADRRRGGAGAVVYNGKIYIVGGIVNGHMDGYQPWFDEYDPKTGKWTRLQDAPHARDHFQAAIVGNKLYAVGGRTTSHATGQAMDLTVEAVDVFDFESGQWQSLDDDKNLPTPRAGNFVAVWDENIIVGGGESVTQIPAHDEVEVFDTKLNQWSDWPTLETGRHGTGFAVINGAVYTASGCGQRGGEPELKTLERLIITNQDPKI